MVWAKDAARSIGLWWPGEALDPFNLPPGVLLTPKQVRVRVGGGGMWGPRGDGLSSKQLCGREDQSKGGGRLVKVSG